MPFDPLSTAATVYQIADTIYEQVKKAKANRKQCNNLYERIRLTIVALKKLSKLPESQEFVGALEYLRQTLNECSRFVEQFTNEQVWYKRVLKAGTHSQKFIDFNSRLDKSSQLLGLEIETQLLDSQAQIKKAQERDYEEIFNQKKLIIELHQQAHNSLQTFHMSQEERDKLIHGQITSLEERIMSLNIASKPTIDPFYHVHFYEIVFDKIILGQGSFGTIYKGKWHGQTVAIKQITAILSDDDQKEFIREIKIMSRLHNENICQFYGVCLEPGRLALLMEYMPNGSLYDIIEKKLVLAPPLRNRIALEIAQGLNYMHSKNIFHRDLKSANVLLDSNWHAKLTDFGLASAQLSGIYSIGRRSQSNAWLAPEVLAGEIGYDKSSADIYSYGTFLWSLFTGQQPSPEIYSNIQAALNQVSESYAGIIKRCWEINPASRIELEEVLAILSAIEQQYSQVLAHEAELHADYSKLAQENQPESMIKLSEIYRKGKGGIQQDRQKSYQLLLESASQGNEKAMLKLAANLAKGKDTSKDIVAANFWFSKLIDKNSLQPKKNRKATQAY